MKEGDQVILEKIQAFFGVGSVRVDKRYGHYIYSVTSLKDLINVIIPYFDSMLLLTKKRAEFILFKSVVDLMSRKEYLTLEGFHKIVAIRALMNLGLTTILTEAFPNIILVPRSVVEVSENIDPNWISGFTEAEGSFYITLRKFEAYKTGYQVQVKFAIAQHSLPPPSEAWVRDFQLINSFIKYFNSSSISENLQAVYFTVAKFSDVE